MSDWGLFAEKRGNVWRNGKKYLSLRRESSILKGIIDMTTAILTDGIQYTIPSSDIAFFKAIASKMGWIATRVGNVVNSAKDMSKPMETEDNTYTLAKLKGRFTPIYNDRDELRDDYLLDKYGL